MSELVPVGMTSRYSFVSYIVDDDPGDVTHGVAEKIHIDHALDQLRAQRGERVRVDINDPQQRYTLFYRRGALVDAPPATPELAAFEAEIQRGVMAAMLKGPRIEDRVPGLAAELVRRDLDPIDAAWERLHKSVTSQCDVCGRTSLLAESVGERCSWTETHNVKPCIGRMTAVIR